MTFLLFESLRAYPDLWMQKSIRKDEVTEYFEYVILYTNDCIVISDQGEAVLKN